MNRPTSLGVSPRSSVPNYKIETKPTLWQVRLEQGAYSDATEENYFVRANDRDEAWHLFKLYWEDQVVRLKEHEYSRGNLLLYVDFDGNEVERFKPSKWSTWASEDDDEPDFDIYYGQAWKVTLYQLEVVEFLR